MHKLYVFHRRRRVVVTAERTRDAGELKVHKTLPLYFAFSLSLLHFLITICSFHGTAQLFLLLLPCRYSVAQHTTTYKHPASLWQP